MLHTELVDDVAVLTLDRQERRNALDRATLEALSSALAGVGSDVRVVMLRGAAGHFCAGADLNGVEDRSFVALLHRVLVRLTEAPFVTLAAVEGAALGAGTQLAISCDLRVATPAASFGIPAAKLGLAVDAWTVRRLTAVAGHSPAQAMLLAAEGMSGERLHELGVVQQLGTPDDAFALAGEVAQLAPLTIQAHKTALAAVADPPAARADSASNGDPAGLALDRAWQSEDLQEGLAAFAERRKPIFRGR